MYILTFIEKLENPDKSTFERVNTDKYPTIVKALEDFKRMEYMKWTTPIMIHGEVTGALVHAPMFGKFAYRDRSEVVKEYKAKKLQAEIDKHVPGEMTELTSFSGEGKSILDGDARDYAKEDVKMMEEFLAEQYKGEGCDLKPFIEEQLKGEIDEFVGNPNNAETMKELQGKVKDTLDSLSYGFGVDLNNPASFNGHGQKGPGKKAPGMSPHLSYGVPPIMDSFSKLPSPLMSNTAIGKQAGDFSMLAKLGSGIGFSDEVRRIRIKDDDPLKKAFEAEQEAMRKLYEKPKTKGRMIEGEDEE